MQVEVKFPDGRRMWQARLEEVGLSDDGQPIFEALPVEDAEWAFVRTGSLSRGIWSAQRRRTT